jgi:predicted DCC family thiol-disulfide oxidoreductase YuxK
MLLDPAMISPITDNKMVVVYDGECPFCRKQSKSPH